MPTSYMIDLETMGTFFNAPVMAIGACEFNPNTGVIGRTFYEAIDIESAFKYGTPSGSTVKWWMEQSDIARAEVLKGYTPLEEALAGFRGFLHGDGQAPVVWGNGATFDISILEYCYDRVLKAPSPWKFWNVRDCRTVKDMMDTIGFKTSIIREGTHHQALDDAIYQAKWVSEGWRMLTSKSTPAEAPVEDLLG